MPEEERRDIRSKWKAMNPEQQREFLRRELEKVKPKK
jgi:hypothetical protein